MQWLFLRRQHYEAPFAMAVSHRLGTGYVTQRLKQGLADLRWPEAQIRQPRQDLAGGIEMGLTVKFALLLVRLISLPQGTVFIYHANEELPAGFENPGGFQQCTGKDLAESRER